MDRTTELTGVLDRLRSRDFTKIAQMGAMPPTGMAPPPPMDPAMMGGAPPMMDPAMMGPPPMDPAMMDPAMMPPEMAPPPEDQVSEEAAKGMKEVAVKALDMAQDTINAILSSNNLSPEEMADAAAATASSTGAFNGIPPEEIAAMAGQQ